MIQISPTAAEKVKGLLVKQSEPELCLRVAVIGGGCSGFQYDMGFDKPRDDDEVFGEDVGVRVVVDSMSYRYLDGVRIDFVETLQGAGFTFENPNAKRSCGCGKSFSA